MGQPSKNVLGYKLSSVLSHTSGMSGKLLLVHGLIDENVHFRHTGTYVKTLLLIYTIMLPLLFFYLIPCPSFFYLWFEFFILIYLNLIDTNQRI